MTEEEEQTPDVIKRIIERIPPQWGKYVSCNSGWWFILEELETKLNFLDPKYEVNQVKEKFGTLRFYYEPTQGGVVQDIMDDCVRQAEYLSAKTCEMCGGCSTRSIPDKVKYDPTVKLRGRGWYKTLCNSCAVRSDGHYQTDEEMENEENSED